MTQAPVEVQVEGVEVREGVIPSPSPQGLGVTYAGGRVVKPLIVSVDRMCYNVVRSFVESSTRLIYPWNYGIAIAENVVVFRKQGKWELTVEETQGDWIYRRELRLAGKHGVVITMEVTSHTTTVVVCNKVEFSPIDKFVFVEGKEVDMPRPIILDTVCIDADVPYSRPISLSEITRKLYYYDSIFLEYLRQALKG